MSTENVTANRNYPLPSAGTHLSVDVARVTAALTAIDADVAAAFAGVLERASLNSPAFTGNPTAPTQAVDDDSGRLATTAFVQAGLALLRASILGGADASWDTLQEIQAWAEEHGDDYLALIETVGGKLSKSENLDDLTSKPAALTNLGFSTFIQSLKAAADAPALRTLIGLSYADASAQAAFRSAIGMPNPAGRVVIVSGNAAAPGTLKANGASYSRTTYADLWAYAQASGNLASQGSKTAGQYGTGDGSTTFTLPDYRGEFMRFWDDAKGIDSGRAIGSSQGDLLEDHVHPNGVISTASGNAGGNGGTWVSGFSNTGSVSTAGVAGSETRPRNIALLACIHY